ncbi:hypothetical protein H0H81_005919 [Sphagnurus paluster]|uniref:Uncharacterized protein n=1 Tax=Sphagnurus paluster TaxID=117069 RepID=A0A9P7GWC4_9AGAR|nr:hypothetical protein H0H81_005919 [Sphagnurus paluster]
MPHRLPRALQVNYGTKSTLLSPEYTKWEIYSCRQRLTKCNPSQNPRMHQMQTAKSRPPSFRISPAKTTVRKTAAPTSTGKSIEEALGSMQLVSGTPDHEQGNKHEDTKAAIRNRRRSSQAPALATAQTLQSLDSESQEIVERLLQPGMFDDDEEDGSSSDTKIAARVVQWQQTIVASPVKPNPKRTKMPCSLSTPSPQSSQETVPADELDVPPAPADDDDNDAASPPTPSVRRPQPLVRSMSVQQRETFLSSLTSSSDATVYVVPRNDIHNIHAEAIKLGFHARIALGKDTSDPQGLVVLGRDEAAVKRLYSQVEIERKKSSHFRAAAGGAVVGAVGAFAGLAFT